MELSQAIVEAQSIHTLPWAETIIAPIGDVQLGSAGVARDALRRHLSRAQALGAYYLGMGDYIDLLSPSERLRVSAADLHDSTYDALEDHALKLIDEFCTLVKGTEDRWLGLLKGHHLFRFRDGRTSDAILAERLGCPLLGRCAMLRLRFRRFSGTMLFHIWCHHGAGGGQTLGATEAKMFRMMARWPDPDWFLVGHENKQWGSRHAGIHWPRQDTAALQDQPRLLAGTGGWVAGYVVGHQIGDEPDGTYVENRMLAPLPIGGILGRIRPIHTRRDDWLEHSIEV